MSVNKEAKSIKKKGIIIDALKRCLARDVYSRITVQDIADEAGFSKGGILHYFRTKEDIYLELINAIFSDLERSHIEILEGDFSSKEMAPISALLGVERFILDKTNTRIILNLILYAFEEEKIMNNIRDFLKKHKGFYIDLVQMYRAERGSKRKSDLPPEYISRIVQTVVLFIGVLELIEPGDLDYVEIVRFVSAQLKG